jgi:VWFA-related protein
MSTHVGFSKLPRVLFLTATLLAPAAAAQEPLKEVIDVRVTNVEIIATDSKGNHVSGLTRDDFELYESGKLQPITNLFEANAGIAQDVVAKVALPRRLVIYLDDSTLLPNNRKPIIPALKKLVADTMTRDDQMMIVTFNQSLKTRLPWTNDLPAVQSALDAIGREVGGGRTRQAARDRIENEIRSLVAGGPAQVDIGTTRGPGRPDFRSIVTSVRNYANSATLDFKRSAAALENLFESLAGVDGRKIVIIASESFPTRPGGDVFAYLENVRNQLLSGAGSAGMRGSARTATISAEASAFNTNETILMLGRIANIAGVTIYAINPDTGAGSSSGNVEHIGPDQMQLGVTETSGVDGLQILARATGGIAWIGTKPAVAFETLRADLQNYYSIGYQAKTSGDMERAIEVRPKRADLRVRAKQSIVFRTVESDMSRRVTSNLQAAQLNDLAISVQVAGDVTTEGDKKRVPVHVLIPARNITVAAEGDVWTGGFSVYICTAGGKAESSDVTRQSHEIKWPPSTIGQLNDRHVTYALEVVMEKGRDLISIGVLDHRSQATGFSKLAM